MDTGSSRAWARPQQDEHGVPHTSGVHGDGKARGAVAGAQGGEARGAVVDAAGNTVEGADGDVSEAESDGSIEQHPFFDGLREKPKEERWDAETILSTYTTTENHPTTIRVARKPRPGKAAITLDPRTGLPTGTMLPAEEERRRGATGEECEDDDDDEGDDWGGPAVNEGEARPRKENAEEKRQRKAAVKAAKAARRQDKKGTKQAFASERSAQVLIRHNTAQPSQIGLSAFGN